jgi:hypothetical protein
VIDKEKKGNIFKNKNLEWGGFGNCQTHVSQSSQSKVKLISKMKIVKLKQHSKYHCTPKPCLNSVLLLPVPRCKQKCKRSKLCVNSYCTLNS